MDADEAKEVSFVLAGAKRKAILLALDRPQTPSQLSRMVDVSVNNTWVKLQDLQDHGLAKCLNPSARRIRIYARTKKGEKIARHVKAMDSNE